MKKIYVGLFLSSAILSNAQLTQSNHAPADGESYQMYEVDPVSVSPGPAGAGITWNFTAATLNTAVVNTFTAANVSGGSYPSANIAVGSGADNISYLASGSSSLLYYGGNISVQTVKASLNYSAPAIYASYPMTITTSSATAIGGAINVTAPMTAAGTFTGQCVAVADGNGTLVLSSGTYSDVLRISVTQTLDFSLMSGTFNGTLVMTAYEWYATGIKAPLFTITSGTANVLGQTYVETLAAQNKNATPSGTTNIGEQQIVAVGVYPQPGFTTLNVDLPMNGATMEVFDLAGRSVATYVLRQRTNEVDISGYPGGLFTYTLKSETGKVMHSGRFTVAR